MSSLHLGVDLGTSSLKVVACREDGSVAAEHEAALSVHTPHPGWSEGDPEEWARAVADGLAAVLDRSPGSVAGVGVTGQMHGTVLVGADGRAVRPAVLWPDTRARDQAPRWAGLPGPVQARLGGPFSPGLTGPVLAWLHGRSDGRAGGLADAERVLLPKDWVRHRLTGTPPTYEVTDRSDAAATLLWDVADDAWSPDAVAVAVVPPGLLPPAVPSPTVVGSWRGAPVVAGGGDTPVSLVALERAVGGWRRGDLVVNLGTGAQVIDPVAAAPTGDGPPGWHVYADAGTGLYAMVAILSGGLALSWARDRLGMDWASFAAAATSQPAGAGGTLFAPFVTDERGAMQPALPTRPQWLGAAGDPARQARAAAEAQVFLVRRAATLLGLDARRVLLVGGGGRDLWVQQLLADTLDRPVHRVAVRSAAAVGAAALAAPAADWIPAGVRSVEPRSDREPLEAAYLAWRAVCYPTDA